MYYEEYTISLTGADSHKIKVPLGQGSLSIGTKGISKGKYDVWVEPDSMINWDAFDNLYTGYGAQNKEKYPYGNWPRWFYYSGNDTGFIGWSRKRYIEEFHWTPHADVSVDFTGADIYRLFIGTKNARARIRLGEKTLFLWLSGRLENFDVMECDKIPPLAFCPEDPKEEGEPYRLPFFGTLAQARHVEVHGSPDKAAFDCESLRQFRNLASLALWGNMTGLDALADLKNLESLSLRYIPDLKGMPGLETWEHLSGFIGWNIEESAGKVFRAELKALKKERTMAYADVSQLRKPIWFTTEYGLLFSGWEETNAKKAARAYKKCYNQIKKAATEDEVHAAIVEFVEKINRLDNIETTGREDAGTAVGQLVEHSSLEIPDEKWMLWFDEAREF